MDYPEAMTDDKIVETLEWLEGEVGKLEQQEAQVANRLGELRTERRDLQEQMQSLQQENLTRRQERTEAKRDAEAKAARERAFREEREVAQRQRQAE